MVQSTNWLPKQGVCRQQCCRRWSQYPTVSRVQEWPDSPAIPVILLHGTRASMVSDSRDRYSILFRHSDQHRNSRMGRVILWWETADIFHIRNDSLDCNHLPWSDWAKVWCLSRWGRGNWYICLPSPDWLVFDGYRGGRWLRRIHHSHHHYPKDDNYNHNEINYHI